MIEDVQYMDGIFVHRPAEVDIESLMGHIQQLARLRQTAPTEHAPQIPEESIAHDRDAQDSIGEAFLAQAELNRSLVQSLAALGQNIQDVQGHFSKFEREYRANTVVDTKANQELSDQINRLYSSNTSLEAISRRVDGITTHEVLQEHKIAQRLQELQCGIDLTQAAINELSKRVELIIARLSTVEHKLHSQATVEQRLIAGADHTIDVEQYNDEQVGNQR